MPQVYSEKLGLRRKQSLQRRMASSAGDRKLVKRNNRRHHSMVHFWIKSFKKPKNCWTCNSVKALDWACVDTYKKSIRSFKALCRKCHLSLDLGGGFSYCKNGHKKTDDNTYYYKESSQNYGCSECMICRYNYRKSFVERNTRKP